MNAALNPLVGQMVKALNVVLQQSGSHIESKQDFCDFIEHVERFKTESSSGGGLVSESAS
ncbi:hypothetical protein VCRA2123O159_350016 [Vibrio crassostreae]|nr:hypothetical protein VCRA2113O138_350010 [Vibrio crassostreae]CAK2914325.1 hypothetical protein VCRA2119O148_350003 [Vibrio crassostreae]CAK2964970.1 hypothetical protein VCRA2119O149_5310001 [Vibrio crassostreae]CAK3413841.1 hypothetical protein VCRA2121O156_340009 [Vibrio crassostreae]CAK3548875.1 hypothetical protein VCRA2121O155_350031 [Vibrio crassostreae]